jgi:DNA adenine methylase
MKQLSFFDSNVPSKTRVTPINVATVPQRSPFRYPGGKTWLIPDVRRWMKQEKKGVSLLVEPFAGGGIVSLTAAFEGLAENIIMSELDPEIAAVWEVILNGDNEYLANRIFNFEITPEKIQLELHKQDKDLNQVAFCTILKNRVFHGGIITKGAGMMRNGENGKGLLSRWYPKTLRDRILSINLIKHKINFLQEDAFDVIEKYKNIENAYFFIDPPYTIAGKRLYTYHDIDHEKLFSVCAQIKGKFMLTYDDTEEVRFWAEKYNLKYKNIPMKTTHNIEKMEALICDNLHW